MFIFKIKKKHIEQFAELDTWDLGSYGLKISDDREVMVYESKAIAEKALQYFKKTFKGGAS